MSHASNLPQTRPWAIARRYYYCVSCLRVFWSSIADAVTLPAGMAETGDSDSALQRQLPAALQLHILALLPPNERALSGRKVFRDAFYALSDALSCTASLGQPLPPHAVPWAVEAGQQYVRQLPFKHKLQLLCTAAASGSEVNLEVAWAVLQPSIFPEMLRRQSSKWCKRLSLLDPGVAAAKAGHPQVLGWLLQHCPALLSPSDVLAAAARHCDLAGLQAVWEALQQHSSDYGPRLGQEVLDAAAESAAPDALAKMEWLLGAAGSECRWRESTILAAIRSGDVRRLQWLQGLRYGGGESMVSHALLHADLAVAQWLVDQAGCSLPEAGDDYFSWRDLLKSSARGCDGVAKLQWLRERGAPPLQGLDRRELRDLVHEAVAGGQAGVVQHLVSVYGSQELLQGPQGAFKWASGRLSPQTADSLHQMGVPLDHEVYGMAARAGNLGLFRWLAQDRKASARMVSMYDAVHLWPNNTAAQARDMLTAVQLLLGAGTMVDTSRLREALQRAAARGSLALIRYLLQICHPAFWPDPYAVPNAVETGCEELLELLARQPTGLYGRRDSAYVVAGKNGDRATLTALRRLGVPWGAKDLVVEAVSEGCQGPVLRWLVEQGAPVGSKERLEASVERKASTGELDAETAAWLRGLSIMEESEEEEEEDEVWA